MNIIYNIGIYLYILGAYIYSIFNNKANLLIKGRKDIFQKLLKNIQGEDNVIWFHCASLGEFEQAQPIIKAYKIKHPEDKIILTFFSPSGYEIKKNCSIVNWVYYLPFDTRYNAKKFVKIINPRKVFFIKNEFWFNYMDVIKQQNIPFFSVSAIFREEHMFFKYTWCANQLKNISHFFVQDRKSKNLLSSIGMNNATIINDTRFDTVIENRKSAEIYPLIKKFCSEKTTIIFGSIYKEDEKLLIKYMDRHLDYNYIIVPHEINYSSNIRMKTNGTLFTNLTDKNVNNNNILIINKMGILKSIYKYSNIAYIGGGFSNGIHNVLEAIVYGVPVIFGPNYHKSLEAQELINLNIARSITNLEEMNKAIDVLKNINTDCAQEYIKEKSGGSKKIIGCKFI
tara:strand:- start:1117 stop:2307 length:1191 start_codon:yes stop_codon:yes gene_type:complete